MTPLDIRNFEVSRLVIHDVPPPDVGTHGPLVLTDEPISLDDDLRSYFSRKVVESLGLRGLDVIADTTRDAVVRAAAVSVLADSTSLVEQSRFAAQHLYTVQTNTNSPGLLAVIEGDLGADRCLALVKLEREQGLRFRITAESDGRTVVDLELLRDLTLTDRTRVFKTAVLVLPEGGEAQDVTGRVSDDQRGRDEGVGVAEFWMGRFLGCQLAISPARATHDFVTAAERFFNTQVSDVERRARYQVALLARMQDNTMEIRPRGWAEQHLESSDIAPFLSEIQAEGLQVDVPFQKDTSLVRVKNGFRMTFESGMVLIGSMNDLGSRVEPAPDNSKTIIHDAQSKLRGR